MYSMTQVLLAKIISDSKTEDGNYARLGMIIVDYLNQVKRHTAPSRSGQYDWTEQIEISKGLKQLLCGQQMPSAFCFPD